MCVGNVKRDKTQVFRNKNKDEGLSLIAFQILAIDFATLDVFGNTSEAEFKISAGFVRVDII